MNWAALTFLGLVLFDPSCPQCCPGGCQSSCSTVKRFKSVFMGLLNVYGLSQAIAGIKIMIPHSHNKHWNEKGEWQSVRLV